ncbi:amino acid/amide ABC transporter membrane protein 2, HAAT family [Thermaerobacter marianensis DSM 12885]|uniref:Amino acid/amide ABC transporter membrane protein 2, HAAT family n=1 Tax=Thermaerobacter marianensis (strain ATCC 700841 / DSM 12885 / JCM 10246 / 7p75a) TaxID=644966 RepID=E6SHD2_THEM7|nr:branched-chain amino acid ABC transporter permease [Thermaerobacter marianensis]ADU50696.1 amino acid/amide ABC transporter membrane protein 2, HAAT family [Thermaerobacter marianensis DSM 12885]
MATRAAAAGRRGPAFTRLAAGVALLVALAFPALVGFNAYYLEIGFNFFLWAMLGLSLNFILGGTGQYNLGHAAFFAAGAYTTAILNTKLDIPVLVLLPVAAAVAGLLAVAVARPIVHLRGDYLLIVTVGFAEIVRITLRNNVFGITGGSNGILGIDRPVILGLRLADMVHFYYLSLLFLLVTVAIAVRLENSRVGRAWSYIREDEVAAAAMGIDTARYKLLAFAVGGALAGAAGNLYAAKMTVIAPESFSFWESVVMFAIVILGGTGSIPGVFLGTFGMVVLPQLFRGLSDYRMLVFGAAMVVLMIFRPEGLWPSRRWRLAVRGADEPAAPGAAGTGLPAGRTGHGTGAAAGGGSGDGTGAAAGGAAGVR